VTVSQFYMKVHCMDYLLAAMQANIFYCIVCRYFHFSVIYLKTEATSFWFIGLKGFLFSSFLAFNVGLQQKQSRKLVTKYIATIVTFQVNFTRSFVSNCTTNKTPRKAKTQFFEAFEVFIKFKQRSTFVPKAMSQRATTQTKNREVIKIPLFWP